MKRWWIFLSIHLAGWGFLAGQNGFVRWYGGIADESGQGIVALPDGGMAVCGHTSNGAANQRDAWLLRCNSNGDTLWSRTFQMLDSESASDLSVAHDGGFLMCGSTSNSNRYLYVIKTDDRGDKEWENLLSWADESWAEAGVATPSGKYAVAGGTLTLQPGRDDWDGLVAVFNPDGSLDWKQAYPQIPAYQFNSIRQTDDGGFLLAGNTTNGMGGEFHAALARIDSAGGLLWWKEYGTETYAELYDVQITPDGGFAAAGFAFDSTGGGNAWLLRTDANGDSLWSRTFGGAEFDQFLAMESMADGGWALTGSTDSEGAGLSDAWILRTDSLGDSLWSFIFGSVPEDQGNSIAVATNGDLIVTGNKGNPNVLGTDLYLARVSALGTISIDPAEPAVEIALYPNPAHSPELRLDADDKHFPIQLSVYNPAGQVIHQQQLTPSHSQINLPSPIPSGLYLLQGVTAGNQPFSRKFLLTPAR